MRVAVLGGSGWFGSHLIPELLRREVEVANLDLVPTANRDVEFRRTDVLEPLTLLSILREVRPDRVVHLAAYLGQAAQANPYAAYRLNIQGSANVLECCRQLGIERAVLASSSSIYGDVEGDLLREDAPRRPTTVYGMTKLAVEHLGAAYMEQYGLQFVALRPAHGYGPGRSHGHMKDVDLIEAALQGREVHLRGGSQTYEPVYVKDTARALAAAALAPKLNRLAFNVGIGRRISLVETAEILRRHIPEARYRIEPGLDRSGSDRTRTSQPPMDISAAREELGWAPAYPPERGYAELIEWIRRS